MPYGPAFTSLPLKAATATSPATRYIDEAAYNALLDNWVNWKADQNAAGFNLAGVGRITYANGSAAAPTLAFTNSLTTGLFRRAADAIGVATAGVERFYITSGGIINFGATAVGARVYLYEGSGSDRYGFGIQAAKLEIFSSSTGVVGIGYGDSGAFTETLRIGTDVVSVLSGKFQITGIPTSASGLASGRVWSNGGVLTIVA